MANTAPAVFVFDATNPTAQTMASQFGATRVVDTTASTKSAIRATIRRSIAEGIPPRQSAKLIRNVIGLTDRQAQSVLNFRGELAADGVTGRELERQVKRLSDRLLRQRALTIARHETIEALAMGRRHGWDQAQSDGLLRGDEGQRWFTNPDPSKADRPCEICEPMDGQTVGMDEQFTTGTGDTVSGEPAHVVCRCGVRLVSAADLEKFRETGERPPADTASGPSDQEAVESILELPVSERSVGNVAFLHEKGAITVSGRAARILKKPSSRRTLADEAVLAREGLIGPLSAAQSRLVALRQMAVSDLRREYRRVVGKAPGDRKKSAMIREIMEAEGHFAR